MTGLNELLNSVDRGTYRPDKGTVGDLLAKAHPSVDRFTAERSLAIFARLGFRKYGIWIPVVLDSDPDTLTDEETDYLVAAWKSWTTGGRRVTS